MAVLRDQSLLLSRTSFGESSLVVQLLTRKYGRVHLLAKGAYRATSRFFCVLDSFHTLDLEWSETPRRELGLLRRGSIAISRKRVPSELEQYRPASSMLELTNLAARPGQADSGLFDNLSRGLDALVRGEESPQATLVVFELGFLQNLGLFPSLEACAACGGPADPVSRDGRRAAFSAGAGGRLCQLHAEEARASGRRVGTLPVEVLEAAAELFRSVDSPRPTQRKTYDADLLARVRDFLERFTDYHLESRPRTHRDFLSVPNRNAPNEGSLRPLSSRET